MLDVQTHWSKIQDGMNGRLAEMAAAAHELERKMQDGTIVREVLQGHADDIMTEQHKQLLEGKGSDGNDLRPYYTEDLKPQGYFWSPESAANYMAWKESLTYPYGVTRTNSNAPNLYINGRFYNEMEVKFNADSIVVAPATGYAAGIMAKYGLQRFGLSMLKWNVIMFDYGCKEEIQDKIKDILYG